MNCTDIVLIAGMKKPLQIGKKHGVLLWMPSVTAVETVTFQEHMMSRFKFIDLFAGIGGIRLGFEAHGGECVFSSEWDTFAQDTYEANFGERPHGDITKINPKEIPEHDILLGGFPCQAFSICGDQKGFLDTRGTLFFNIEQILKEKNHMPLCLRTLKI